MTNQLGYRGEWHDSQDSQNLRARNYDMSMGRFFQEDSEMGDLDEPGTQNKYAYVGNNPLGYSDESGNKRRGGFRGFVRKVFRPVVRYVRRYTPPRRPYRPAPRRYYPRPAPRKYYPRPVYRAPVRRYVPKRPVYRAPVRRYTPRKVYKAVKKVVRRASPKKVASYNKATKAKKASKGKKVQKKPSILAKARKKINQAKKAVKKTVKSVKKTVKKVAKKVSQKTVSLAKKANEVRKKVVNKVCQTAKTVWNGTKKFYNENKEVIIKTIMVVAGIGMMAVPGLQGSGAGLLYGMTILDVTSAATGKDWLTQRKLSPGERVLNVVTAIPVTKIAGKMTGFSLKGSNSVVKATTAGTKNATKNVANSVKPTPKPNIVSETEGFTINSGKGTQTSTTNSANRKLTDGAVAGDNIGNNLRAAGQKELTAAEKQTYKRPSGYRKGVRDEVWDNAKNVDGVVKDPLTDKVLKADEPWDMGHKPGYEFKKHQQSAAEREISRKQFLDEHNNTSHYRPELPSSNRGHAGEDVTNNYFGP